MSGKRQMRFGAGVTRDRHRRVAVQGPGSPRGGRERRRLRAALGTCRVLGAPGSSGRGPMWTSGALQEQSSGEGASGRCGDTADPGWVSRVRQHCRSCWGRMCPASFHLVSSPPEFPAAPLPFLATCPYQPPCRMQKLFSSFPPSVFICFLHLGSFWTFGGVF